MNSNMKTVCSENQCVGCKACITVCKHGAITVIDDGICLNAVIDETKCMNCSSCYRICQNNSEILYYSPVYWKQGWTSDEIRMTSSSGGIAQSLMRTFLTKGGEVYSCTYKYGEFIYRKVNSVENTKDFVGSKYVKSCPDTVFSPIKETLKKGSKVLFIGLPCHVQALKLFVGKYSENLYCVDLICHGTPSREMLKRYLKEEGVEINTVTRISFRNQNRFFLRVDNELLSNNDIDYWIYPFLKGLTYTENCYNCKFARFERVSDMTIGDAWGTNLSKEEQSKGISLMLINTQKGNELLKSIEVYLEEVDIERIKERNTQLVKPSEKPVERMIFESNYQNGYKKTIKKCYGKLILKKKLRNTFIGKVYKKLTVKTGNDI